MSSNDLCRVCRNGDIKMHNIQNIELQEIYEKLTNTSVSAEERLPRRLCYICYSLLLKCLRFSDMARQSEELLRNQVNNNSENVTCSILPPRLPLNLVIKKNLSVTVAQACKSEYLNNKSLVTPAEDMYGNNYICFNEDTLATIKIEDDVKSEPQSENEDFVKIETYRDNDMHNEIQKEEHSVVKYTKVFGCKLCNSNFSSKHLLSIHSETHRVIKPLSCSMCHRSYFKVSCLRRHLTSCPGEPKMTCSECNNIFTDIDLFESHIKTHSVTQCSYCDKVCKTKTRLKEHMRTHSVKKPFECVNCGKFFKRRHTLKAHMKTHDDARPFRCEICGKSYPLKGTLKSHMICHTGERPFTCDTCGVTCAFKSSLVSHIKRLHTSVKAHPCNLCYRSFSHESDLKGHMRSHTNQTRMTCNLCNKQFLNSRYLKQHIMYVHSKERPYVCVCGKSYKTPKNLGEHRRKNCGQK